jgi:hypothetical protein
MIDRERTRWPIWAALLVLALASTLAATGARKLAATGARTTGARERAARFHIERASFQWAGGRRRPRMHTFVAAILEVVVVGDDGARPDRETHSKEATDAAAAAAAAAASVAGWHTPRLICGPRLFGDASFRREILEPQDASPASPASASASPTTADKLERHLTYTEDCGPSSLHQLPSASALLMPLVPASYPSHPHPHTIATLFRPTVSPDAIFAVGFLLNYTIDSSDDDGAASRATATLSRQMPVRLVPNTLRLEDCSFRVFDPASDEEIHFEALAHAPPPPDVFFSAAPTIASSSSSSSSSSSRPTTTTTTTTNIDEAVHRLIVHISGRSSSFLEEQLWGLPEPPDPMAQVKGVVSAVGGIVNPAVEGVLKPVVKDMGEVVSDTVGGVVEATLTPEASGDMKDAMNRDLVPGLIDGIVSNLSPTLAQSFPDSITETLSESMREFMADALSNSLRPKLVASLTDSLAEQISLDTTKLVPTKISEGIHKVLNMMLTRSLSHSITPALIHSLSHSPLQDFYCYYCFHHKAYCQFCTYAPSQLYYAMYYSGFYSEYYSNYYSDVTFEKKADSVRPSDGSTW